jgi:hypothetical protein
VHLEFLARSLTSLRSLLLTLPATYEIVFQCLEEENGIIQVSFNALKGICMIAAIHLEGGQPSKYAAK